MKRNSKIYKYVLILSALCSIIFTELQAKTAMELLKEKSTAERNLIYILGEEDLISCAHPTFASAIANEIKNDLAINIILVISGEGAFKNADDSFFRKFVNYTYLIKDANSSIVKKYKNIFFVVNKNLNITETFSNSEYRLAKVKKDYNIEFSTIIAKEPITSVSNPKLINGVLHFDDLIQGKAFSLGLDNKQSELNSLDFFQYNFDIKNKDSLGDSKEYYLLYWDNKLYVNPGLLFSVYNGSELLYASDTYDSVKFYDNNSTITGKSYIYKNEGGKLRKVSENKFFTENNTIFFNGKFLTINKNNTLEMGYPDSLTYYWGDSTTQMQYFSRKLNRTFSPYNNIAIIDNSIYYISEQNSLLCKLNFSNGKIISVDTLKDHEQILQLFYRGLVKPELLSRRLLSGNTSITGFSTSNDNVIIQQAGNDNKEYYQLIIFDKDLKFIKRVIPNFSYYEKDITSCKFVGIYDDNYLFLVYSNTDGWLLAKTSCLQY